MLLGILLTLSVELTFAQQRYFTGCGREKKERYIRKPGKALKTDHRILEALFKFALKELVARVLYFTYNFWIRT